MSGVSVAAALVWSVVPDSRRACWSCVLYVVRVACMAVFFLVGCAVRSQIC